mmetsp:Transcript_30262/g.69288  ORF Transcript_30262/g.69288 Transcript_30262/m.69288 type:complete len:340 (+) Transcript_30262:273-1292(+)
MRFVARSEHLLDVGLVPLDGGRPAATKVEALHARPVGHPGGRRLCAGVCRRRRARGLGTAVHARLGRRARGLAALEPGFLDALAGVEQRHRIPRLVVGGRLGLRQDGVEGRDDEREKGQREQPVERLAEDARGAELPQDVLLVDNVRAPPVVDDVRRDEREAEDIVHDEVPQVAAHAHVLLRRVPLGGELRGAGVRGDLIECAHGCGVVDAIYLRAGRTRRAGQQQEGSPDQRVLQNEGSHLIEEAILHPRPVRVTRDLGDVGGQAVLHLRTTDEKPGEAQRDEHQCLEGEDEVDERVLVAAVHQAEDGQPEQALHPIGGARGPGGDQPIGRPPELAEA